MASVFNRALLVTSDDIRKQHAVGVENVDEQSAAEASILLHCFTMTGVSSSAASKKCFAISAGIRMQPCEAR